MTIQTDSTTDVNDLNLLHILHPLFPLGWPQGFGTGNALLLESHPGVFWWWLLCHPVKIEITSVL